MIFIVTLLNSFFLEFFFGTEAEKDPVKSDFIDHVILISHIYITVIFCVLCSSGFTLINLLIDA